MSNRAKVHAVDSEIINVNMKDEGDGRFSTWCQITTYHGWADLWRAQQAWLKVYEIASVA
jgi:hypothetical protein